MTVTTEQALTWPLTVSRWSPANSSTDSPQYCSQARSLRGGAWASTVAAKLSGGRTSSLDPNGRDLHHWPHYGTVWASQLIAADVSTCFIPSKIITHIWKTVKETLAVQKDRSVMGEKNLLFLCSKSIEHQLYSSSHNYGHKTHCLSMRNWRYTQRHTETTETIKILLKSSC